MRARVSPYFLSSKYNRPALLPIKKWLFPKRNRYGCSLILCACQIKLDCYCIYHLRVYIFALMVQCTKARGMTVEFRYLILKRYINICTATTVQGSGSCMTHVTICNETNVIKESCTKFSHLSKTLHTYPTYHHIIPK